jgi:hypothetical protein
LETKLVKTVAFLKKYDNFNINSHLNIINSLKRLICLTNYQ